MAKQWKIKEKVFIISGGASGLGAAYTEAFLKEGAKNMVIWDIADHMGQTTVKRLNDAYGNRVNFMKCDVSKEEDLEQAFQDVITLFKRIDVTINNAGVMDDTFDMWRTACTVNIKGVISPTLKGIEFMRKDKGGAGGTIINISSTLALTKGPYLPIYSSAKLAVLHFSQCISMEPFYSQTGIRILTMCPGATNTPLLQGLDKKTYDPKLGQILLESNNQSSSFWQKVESATEAFLYMFKNGSPGSIWLSIDDKPARDITSLVDEGFKTFEKEILFTE